jgi:anaerobic selenocysteine-containing dehydrogenase
MKRREFLITTALGASSTVLLESCGHQEEKVIPLLIAEEPLIPGVEEWTASVCSQCAAGCGILVRTMAGERETTVNGERVRQMVRQAKKIEGHPDHPLNRGRLCARGQAALQVLYNPDRIKTPLQRTGARGSGQFRAISWDEALHLVTAQLIEVRRQNEPHTLLFLTGVLPGHRRTVVERFLQAFGSPNHAEHDLFAPHPVREAQRLTMGYDAYPAYDLERTNYLLSFGAGFLETYLSPVRYSRGFGHLRQGRPGHRGKVVHIEPRFSLTAARADEWVSPKPGTEGALALALAHVILEQQLYDREFIARSTQGFDEFRRYVQQGYDPDRVASLTEVPAARIRRLAQEFATHRPAVALCGDGATAQTNGLFTALAVTSLNALVGAIGTPGGIFFDPPPPLAALPPVVRDATAREGLRHPPLIPASENRNMRALAERLLSSHPYPVRIAFLYETNPVFTLPDAVRMKEALDRIPFLVSFSSFLDETAVLADVILPDHTSLESWTDAVPLSGSGGEVYGVGKPIVPPLYDTRSAPDVLIALAKAIGGSVAASFPWENFSELLKDVTRGLFAARRGSVVADDFDTFWDHLLEKGGWWDESAPSGVTFQTPTGKFDFVLGSRSPDLPALMAEPRFGGTESEYPFSLWVYPSVAFGDGRGANQPWLQEMPDPMTAACWGSWVEINPTTAQHLGLKENDLVWIESPHGKIQAPVLLYPGARPDTIHIPVGQGHDVYGRYAARRGVNPLKILAPLVEPVTGALAWAATRVKVSKADGTKRVVKVGFDRHSTQAERR